MASQFAYRITGDVGYSIVHTAIVRPFLNSSISVGSNVISKIATSTVTVMVFVVSPPPTLYQLKFN